MTQPPFDFDPQTLTVAPSPFLEARETSALAAIAHQPKRCRQNEELMRLLEAAGEDGLSDPEIQQMTGWPRQTICIRRFDLRGWIVPADRRAKAPSGRLCVCWRRASTEEMQQRALPAYEGAE
jgi:hypothetical protein